MMLCYKLIRVLNLKYPKLKIYISSIKLIGSQIISEHLFRRLCHVLSIIVTEAIKRDLESLFYVRQKEVQAATGYKEEYH